MIGKKLSVAVAAMAMSGMFAAGSSAAELEAFVTGLNSPLAMVQPPGDDRLFILEQFGRIRIIQDGELLPTPFLDNRNRQITNFADFDERGLLGLAFHPDFQNNGKFYIAYSGIIVRRRPRQGVLVGPHQHRFRVHGFGGRSKCRRSKLGADHFGDGLAAVQP